MKALLVVDVQNDFMPWGALPVREGDAVVAVCNRLAARLPFVVATQDWHPVGHGSFASAYPGSSPGDVVELGGVSQVLWPDHCVQGTPGASFHSALDVARIDAVVRKGADPSVDSYSGFFDNGHLVDTGLADLLRAQGVNEIWLVGLATDYCVKYTALDGRAAGFEVVVVEDGVRAVELEAGDGQRALAAMEAVGCRVALSSEVPPAL